MPAFQINDAEWAALVEEPGDVFLLYCSIRRFMDYATGIAGIKRRISEQMLRVGFTSADAAITGLLGSGVLDDPGLVAVTKTADYLQRQDSHRATAQSEEALAARAETRRRLQALQSLKTGAMP